MKLLLSKQVQKWDQFTIRTQNIPSKDLMLAASKVFTEWLIENHLKENQYIAVVAGPGNNGGDGFCVAGILLDLQYTVDVFHMHTGNISEDCQYYKNVFPGKIYDLATINKEIPPFDSYDMIIDALFGTGLHSPIRQPYLHLVEKVNESDIKKISIDIPSGMYADGGPTNTSIIANDCLSFEIPKIAFFQCHNSRYLFKWSYASIGLDENYLKTISSDIFFINKNYMSSILKSRNPCSHKGTYGKALVVGGEYGMAGAIVLASKAAYKIGAGLVEIHTVEENRVITQISIPEAIYKNIEEIKPNELTASSIGIGPGMGIDIEILKRYITISNQRGIPIVIDADGLNTIAEYKYLHRLPPKAILTPHPKEFERLVGKYTDENMHDLQLKTSKKYNIYIVLKGRYTSITTPDGKLYYNQTGNAGMATGGSGDVLTGIICGLLAQGYSEQEAATLGVYIHGLAGDKSIENISLESIMASDIINHVSNAYISLKSSTS